MNSKLLCLTACATVFISVSRQGVQAAPAADKTSAKSQNPNKAETANKPTEVSRRGKEPIRLGTPLRTTGVSQGDTVQVTLLKPFYGRLVYTLTQREGNKKPFLVLHDIQRVNGQKTNTGKTYPVTTYPIQRAPQYSDGEAFGPVWSPNGRYVLFKFGRPWLLLKSYQLYVLDTVTNELTMVSDKRLDYELVSWSPDSNYIAFIENGDYAGNTSILFDDYNGPLKLYVCNWRTGKEHLVTSNDTVRGPFHWIAPHTLIYGELSMEGQKILREKILDESKKEEGKGKDSKPASAQQPPVVSRPNIYEYSVESGKSRLLTKDGYLPVPSPSGEWIAFYGSENPEKPTPLNSNWQWAPGGSAVSVMRRDGTGRIALNREQGVYSSICWLPDNRHLLTLKLVRQTPDTEAEIKEWDIETRRFRLVATLRIKDYQASSSYISPAFRLLGTSKDGTTLFVAVSKVVDKQTGGTRLIVLRSLQSVELSTGSVTTLAQVKSALLDWHIESIISENKLQAAAKVP